MIERKPRTARSPKWAALAKRFLKGKACAVCGRKERVVPHHILPYHLYPTLELDESNLIPLCENRSHNCHFWIGHLGSWRSYAADVVVEAARLAERLLSRPVVEYKPDGDTT